MAGKYEFKIGDEGLNLWRKGTLEVELKDVLELRGVL
jgi:hypothetical protein